MTRTGLRFIDLGQNLIGHHCTLSSFVTVLVPYKIKFQNTFVGRRWCFVFYVITFFFSVLEKCWRSLLFGNKQMTQSLFEAFLEFIANSEKLQKGFYWSKVWGREVFETQVLLRPNGFSAIIENLWGFIFCLCLLALSGFA